MGVAFHKSGARARVEGGLHVRRVVAPAPCPSRVLRSAVTEDRPFALISGAGDPELSGWSYAALEPMDRVGGDGGFAAAASPAFSPVADFVADRSAEMPPFLGGAVGYESYDRGWAIAPKPRLMRADPLGMPGAAMFIYDAIYAKNERTGEGWLLAQPTAGAMRRCARLQSCVEGSAAVFAGDLSGGLQGALSPGVDRRVHLSRIAEALELIRAGEIYQVNLTYPLVGRYLGDPRAAFFRLLAAAPPFAAFFRVSGDAAIVSASPECFFSFDAASRRIATYPIKGTRPRSADRARDIELALELASDAKERAEHLMIVDLLRNDVGRIASIGSVGVSALAYVESFARVHHLTSRVVGSVAPEVSIAEIMRALFPGGSITGAPKLRAMEVIDALEAAPRGVYTGAIGWVGAGGSAGASIAIRTAAISGGEVRFGVGGGIVADSDPAREWEETEIKSRALADALAR